jgi:hypothetical protein
MSDVPRYIYIPNRAIFLLYKYGMYATIWRTLCLQARKQQKKNKTIVFFSAVIWNVKGQVVSKELNIFEVSFNSRFLLLEIDVCLFFMMKRIPALDGLLPRTRRKNVKYMIIHVQTCSCIFGLRDDGHGAKEWWSEKLFLKHRFVWMYTFFYLLHMKYGESIVVREMNSKHSKMFFSITNW